MMAAIALVIIIVPDSKRLTVIHCLLIAIFSLFSYFIRKESFIIGIIIFILIYIFKIIKNRKYFFSFIIIVSIIIIGISTEKYINIKKEKASEWVEYNNFYREQSLAALNQNILINNSDLEIEHDEFLLISYWCYLMENNNIEYYKKYNELNKNYLKNIKKVKMDFIRIFKNIVYELYKYAKYYIAIICFMIFGIFYLYKKNRSNVNIINIFDLSEKYLFFVFIIFCFFLGYLLFIGKFPARVFFLLLLLSCPNILIALCILFNNKYKKKIIISIVLIILFINIVNIKNYLLFSITLESKRKEMEMYSMNNQENIFIYDTSLILDVPSVFTVFNIKKPTNLIYWGGWEYYTPSYYQKLNLYNIEKLDYKSFLNDNVYLMSTYTKKDLALNCLNSYLNRKLDGTFQVIDTINLPKRNIYIYKFIIPDFSNKNIS